MSPGELRKFRAEFKALGWGERFMLNRAVAQKNQAGDTIFSPALWASFGIPLDIPVELTDGSPWQSWTSVSRTTGQRVTVNSALQLSTVWACVRLIAGTIATLPFGVYQRQSDGSKNPVPKHPAHALIAESPNADMTPTQFWEAFVMAMLLWGDGMAVVERIGKKPISLDFLLPNRITRRRLMIRGGPMVYFYTDFDGTQRQLNAADMLRVAGMSSDGLNGLSVISFGANVFGAAQAADEASGKIFENGLRPSGVLSVDKALTPKQRDDAREGIVEKFAGAHHAGKVLLLENGMKFTGLDIPPEDAQLLQTRHFHVEEICRWFGLPPFMVGHSEKNTSWGTGIEQQMIGFLTFSLRPWLTRIAQGAEKALLTPAERANGFFIDYETDELLRGDHAARAAFWASMAQNGIMTRNEIRNRENLRDGKGGDQLTVQSNLVPLDKLGQTPAAPTGDGFGLPTPAADDAAPSK